MRPARLCVDGTNLLRGHEGYGGPGSRDREEEDCAWLIAALDQLIAGSGGSWEAELYLDGPHRRLPGASTAAGHLRLRFSQGSRADELIIERVRSSRWEAQKVVVVTGDTDLGRQAQEEGARWLKVPLGASLEDLVEWIASRLKL